MLPRDGEIQHSIRYINVITEPCARVPLPYTPRQGPSPQRAQHRQARGHAQNTVLGAPSQHHHQHAHEQHQHLPHHRQQPLLAHTHTHTQAAPLRSGYSYSHAFLSSRNALQNPPLRSSLQYRIVLRRVPSLQGASKRVSRVCVAPGMVAQYAARYTARRGQRVRKINEPRRDATRGHTTFTLVHE